MKFVKLCPHSPAPSTVHIPSSSLRKAHLGRKLGIMHMDVSLGLLLFIWMDEGRKCERASRWSTMLMILKVDIPITNRSSKSIWAIKTCFFVLYKGVRSSVILILHPSIDWLWLIATLNRQMTHCSHGSVIYSPLVWLSSPKLIHNLNQNSLSISYTWSPLNVWV